MECDWRDFQGRYHSFIEDYDEFKKALNKDFPVCLRVNTKRISVQDFIDYLKKYFPKSDPHWHYKELPLIEVLGERSFWGGRLEHHQGLYFMQALSSLVPVRALNLKADDKVLDLCAAPGGKSTDIASYLTGTGVLYANEPNIGRCRVLKANIDRMALENVVVLSERGEELTCEDEFFDKILLDGPCSSEGTIRSSTKKSRYTQYNVSFRKKLHKVQRSLLKRSYELLKPGGVLVYSTCTYDVQENEELVHFALNEYTGLELVDFTCAIPHRKGLQGLDISKRIYPHDTNSIGFYVAKFIKH